MKILSILQKLVPSFKGTILRFPLSAICAVSLAILSLRYIEFEQYVSDEIHFKLAYLSIIGFLWFASVRVFAESRSINRIKELGIGLIPWGIWALYLLNTNSMRVESFALFNIGLFFIPFFAPYIGRKVSDCDFWTYNYQIIHSLAFTILSFIILCGGISLGLFAIEKLFDLDFGYKIYSDLWLLGSCIYAPVYFLSGVPTSFDDSKLAETGEFPKPIKFMVTYAFIPLVTLYMAILYAYYAKIAITANLPKGILSYLTIAFCSFGIISWLAALPLADTGSWLVRFFTRHFFKILIIPAAVLAFAIGIRISDYGMTESRYVIVMAAIWFGLCSAFYLAWQKYPIKYLLVSISLLFILSSFGPWGAENISINSQLGRLDKIITKNNLLNEKGHIDTVSDDVLKEDKQDLHSIFSYMTSSRNKAKKIAHYFAQDHKIHKNIADENYHSYSASSSIYDNINLKPNRNNDYRDNINFSAKKYHNTSKDVKGFAKFKDIAVYFNKAKKRKTVIDGKDYYISHNNGVVTISGDNSLKINFDLRGDLDKLIESADLKDKKYITLDNKYLFKVDAKVGGKKYRLVVENISISSKFMTSPDKPIDIKNINGYLLFDEL